MSVAIRALGLADVALIEELLDAVTPSWLDALAPGASGPVAFVSATDTFLFGAYVSSGSGNKAATDAARDSAGVPAGWLWGVHVRRPDGRTMTYVHELDVLVEYRRRGIGSSLMEAAIVEARQRGSHRLWLVTREQNAPAVGLYFELGGREDVGPSRLFQWDL